MADNSRIYVSAGIYSSETDLTFASAQIGLTNLGIVGEFPKGPVSDTPIKIESYDQFVRCYGGLDPCTYKNSKQLRYEASYIAKQFLKESNSLYISRVLGLSGYNAGTAWLITLGANIDLGTKQLTGTTDFEAVVVYNDGNCVNVSFNDPILQELYDRGSINCSDLGSSTLTTGDTVTVGDRYYGNCETFTGADINMTITGITEPYLCITANTITGGTVQTVETVINVIVNFANGTITEGGKLNINVTSTTSLINLDTSSIRLIDSGLIQFIGGTITHNSDGSINLENGTIILPDGSVIVANNYKICNITGTVQYIECPSSGQNYTCTSGSTTAVTFTDITGSTLTPIKIESGIVEQYFTGTTNHYSANPIETYDNTVVAILRSTASYDSDEVLNFNITQGNLGISSVDGNVIKPYDSFNIQGKDKNGETFTYNVSLDNTKNNYITKTFTSTQQCCDVNSPIYLECLYPNMLDKYYTDGNIYCIKPKLTCCGNLWNYQTQYTNAKTPWIVSELRGNSVRRLFRFHTMGDGNAANSDIKVSITNIKPDSRTFDVEIRRFGDTDSRPVILQRYSRLSLDPSAKNFIGKRIGTIDNCYPDAQGGCYVRVEMAEECVIDGFPSGFEGYLTREYCDAKSPDICYKNCYTTFENPRRTKAYLGISDTVGFDSSLLGFKGLHPDPNKNWTGTTKGFHMDSGAEKVYLEGQPSIDVDGKLTPKMIEFVTGCASFQSESEMDGTVYEYLRARRFTVLPYGGFDGWDIHRERRTNLDLDMIKGNRAQNGLLTGSLDTFTIDNDIVVNSDYYAFLNAARAFSNPDKVDINILVTPTINLQENNLLIEEIIAIVEEERCDTLYIPTLLDCDENGDPIDADQAASDIDGLYDTSYAATFFPWGKLKDNENNRYVWIPPTAEVVRNLAYTDRTSQPWFATAGVNRGNTDFEKLRYCPTQDDRDTLYEARINPMADYKDYGVTIWGNKTLQIDDSALDRINVRRLLLQARKLVSSAALQLLFDQNDDVIRSQFLNLVNPILENIRTQRGLLDFRVDLDEILDGTDGNQLCGNIWIRPTEAVEVLCVGFNVTDSGTSFDNI